LAAPPAAPSESVQLLVNGQPVPAVVDTASGTVTPVAPLPDGAHVPVILMIKTAPDAKTVTERFELHLH